MIYELYEFINYMNLWIIWTYELYEYNESQGCWTGAPTEIGAPFQPNFENYPFIFLPILKILDKY